MNRRQFISSAGCSVALIGFSRSAHAECDSDSNTIFVDAVYTAQAQAHNAGTHLGNEEFQEMFTREMRALIASPRPDSSKQPDGLILNAFFGWDLLPRIKVTIGYATLVSGKEDGDAKIRIDATYRGKVHKILIGIVREDDVSRIADISYETGKSLREHYLSMAKS